MQLVQTKALWPLLHPRPSAILLPPICRNHAWGYAELACLWLRLEVLGRVHLHADPQAGAR